MWRQVFLLATMAVALFSAAKESSSLQSFRRTISAPKGRIIGGEEVVPHSYPFQAGIRINGNALCGGALISPNYVVTAGHCGIVVIYADIILGAHNITDPNESTQVIISAAKVIIHEDYDDYYLWNDIALIELTQPAPLNDNIQVIPIAPSSDIGRTYLDEIATAIGWGLVQDVPYPTIRDISPVLKEVDVAVSNLTECEDYYNDEEGDYVVSTNLCTSGYKNKGTCDGDSGGPLILGGQLIALTSWGTDECEWCAPSVYTRIADYADWIVYHTDI